MGAVVAVLFATGLPDAAAVTVVYPSAGNHVHSSNCPAGDGESHLAPDPVGSNEFFLLSGVSQAVKDELSSATADTSFSTWTFNYDTWATANGTIYIDVYKSVFYSNHSSGVDFHVRYVKGTGDPANLRWVQYVSPSSPFDPDQSYDVNTGQPIPGGNGPTPPANGGFIDPYPNDGADGGPFYWHGGEIASHTNGNNAFGNFDLEFIDHPRTFHPPISSNGMSFELYLVSWDGATTVNYLTGIQWGFEGACVPEPVTLGLVPLGLLAAWRYARRRLPA